MTEETVVVKNLSNVFRWELPYDHTTQLKHFETLMIKAQKAGIQYIGPTNPISPKTDFGIEIEIEQASHILVPATYWMARSDGSLRDNGVEFVSHIIPAAWLKACLMAIFPLFQTKGEFSERTSIHIHINMRSKTVDQILGFILTYLIFERELFACAANARRNSHYCVPLLETNQLNDIFKHWKADWKVVGAWTKYSAVNLAHLKDFGTLEFRQFPGTKDMQKVLDWCNLLMRLDNYCQTTSHEIIMNRAWTNKTITDKQIWLNEIFHEEASLLMPFCLDTVENASDMCRLKQLFSNQLSLMGTTSLISSRSVFGRMVKQKKGIPLKKSLEEEYARITSTDPLLDERIRNLARSREEHNNQPVVEPPPLVVRWRGQFDEALNSQPQNPWVWNIDPGNPPELPPIFERLAEEGQP